MVARTLRNPRSVGGTSAVAAGLPLRLFFHLSLIVYVGAMGTIFFKAASPLMIVCGVLITVLIASDAALVRLARTIWPLFAMAVLALVSAAWSTDPGTTVRQAMQLFFSMQLGLILMGKLGVPGSIKLLVRSMTVVCLLSVFWALAFPAAGIHQPWEDFQAVHAGLWRGVLLHKVTLGAFSGLTLGVLLYFGRRVFGSFVLYLSAVVISAVALWGSGSATGAVVTVVTYGCASGARYLNRATPGLRKQSVFIMSVSVFFLLAILQFGILNQLAELVGRSANLTGRADYWPHVIELVNRSGPIIGFGYVAGFHSLSPLLESLSGTRLTEAHNGFLDMLVAFGYPGAIAITAIHLQFFFRAARLVSIAPRQFGIVAVFPFTVITTILLVSYAESVILSSVGIWSIILTMAVASTTVMENQLRQSALE